MLLRPQLPVCWGVSLGFVLFYCEVLEVSENTDTIHLVETLLLLVMFLNVEDILQEAAV